MNLVLAAFAVPASLWSYLLAALLLLGGIACIAGLVLRRRGGGHVVIAARNGPFESGGEPSEPPSAP